MNETLRGAGLAHVYLDEAEEVTPEQFASLGPVPTPPPDPAVERERVRAALLASPLNVQIAFALGMLAHQTPPRGGVMRERIGRHRRQAWRGVPKGQTRRADKLTAAIPADPTRFEPRLTRSQRHPPNTEVF
jgi:hypothetical protein